MANKVTVIAVGRVKDKQMQSMISEYEKRLRAFCRLNTIELNDDGIEKESKRIMEFVSGNKDITYILDARGKEFTSHEFSELIRKSEDEIRFIIGGPEGITEEAKRDAKLISLSRMTFTHEMARMFLHEQVYRAYMIINNRKYDK